ncbi:hypothetical protein CROQUDRAFT_657605 [Cronartium quercuum f. sp. fusiforme G11]|uniref:Uncharacterized protein n=1 Tax=Cronartium quercuum f. sp. fusiforme G11 TaxID=708437 RepID=A0A9P6NG51_9BASI|nr:hypothetical protein CROQUDRAFT_657605 [Cronartium quercuum f. sp. fusiforme G11]
MSAPLGNTNEDFQVVLQKSVFKAPIETATGSAGQLSPSTYPRQLILNVIVSLSLPSNASLADCEVLPTPDHLLWLEVSLKHLRTTIAPCATLGSSLMTVLLDVLREYVRDGFLCFEDFREQISAEGSKEYSNVETKISHLDDTTELKLASGKPIARLGRARLNFTFSGSTLSNVEGLLAASPLGRPLRAALETVVSRLLGRGFLKRWPLVFNRVWREKIINSWRFQASVANSLKQIASRSRNRILLTELSALRKDPATQTIEEAIAQLLSTLHKTIHRPTVVALQTRDSSDLDVSELDEGNVKPEEGEEKVSIPTENGGADADKVLELDSETEEILDCNSECESIVSSRESSPALSLDDNSSDGGGFDEGLLGVD